MSPLEALQRQLAASLVGAEAPPPVCRPGEVARAGRALVEKRRRAAAHLLPALRRALGGAWPAVFASHVRNYRPTGLRYHLDDAWVFARSRARTGDPVVRRAAAEDLKRLARRFGRSFWGSRVLLQIGTLLRSLVQPFRF